MVESVEPIEILHRAAQAKLGITAGLLASHAFPSASSKKPPKLSNWLNLLTEQVLEMRDLSAQLTISYYQLARWVETGYSLGAPLDGEGVLTGADLLSSFIARVQAVEDLAGSNTEIGSDIDSAMKSNKDHPLSQLSLQPLIDDVSSINYRDGGIKVDPFNFPQLSTDDKVRKVIQQTLKNSVDLENTFKRILSEADDGVDVVEKINDAVQSASSSGAGKADNLVITAGRSIADYAHQKDKRLLLYARGTSSNPCAFCAMLASRGFVYWSATSATKSYRDGGMNSYHDNCHCFPIARWVEASKLPAINEAFQRDWQKVTADHNGKDKLNAWRRWLNQQRRDSRTGVRT